MILAVVRPLFSNLCVQACSSCVGLCVISLLCAGLASRMCNLQLPRAWSQEDSFVLAQLLHHVRLFVTPWTAACQAPLSSTISWLLKFVSIELVMPSNHPILCHPFSCYLQAFPASGFIYLFIFYSESALLIKWPKYWNFSFSISSSNKYSGLTSFRIDRFDLAVQGTLSRVFSSTTV